MKKIIALLMMTAMIAGMTIALSSCRNKETSDEVDNTETVQTVDPEEESSEEGDTDGEEAEDSKDVSKVFHPDEEDVIGNDVPMQIESVILYKNGSIRIIPTDDLKNNELGDSEADSIMPFAESGKIKDMYLCRIGNGGYRTIIALTEEGTVSAINTRALMEDHIIAVMDNLGGRTSFTDIEQREDEDGFGIIGKTEEGDEVLLDPVILPDSEEPAPVEQ